MDTLITLSDFVANRWSHYGVGLLSDYIEVSAGRPLFSGNMGASKPDNPLKRPDSVSWLSSRPIMKRHEEIWRVQKWKSWTRLKLTHRWRETILIVAEEMLHSWMDPWNIASRILNLSKLWTVISLAGNVKTAVCSHMYTCLCISKCKMKWRYSTVYSMYYATLSV